MEDFNAELSKVLKYSTDDLKTLLETMTPATQNGLGPDADHTHRGVAADKLQEEGREVEAHLLRDGHPIRMANSTNESGWKIRPDYPSYAHPGGYPLMYSDASSDGSPPLCPDCINDLALHRAMELAKEGTTELEDPKKWTAEVHYEGPPMQCAACERHIASAYGDPDAEEGQ